jgi:dTDP-4-amino-4,6-dideoxygalactose transaminase
MVAAATLDASHSNRHGERKKGIPLKSGIPFFQHDLGQPELDEIADVFSGPILTTGDKVAQFEELFASYLGRRHALGVTSCTGALHMALMALGIGPGDEVITTPMTFIATATAIIEAGAKPVFVDVEQDSGNLDAQRVEAAVTPRTRAILPVHLYGLMCDMLELRKLADRHRLAIIEDCAHCVEGVRDGVRPGQLSDAACFSFYATKNLTCGEGGAIVTDRDDLAQNLRLLRLHGMTKTAADRHREGYAHWDMTILGWKYNMDNIQAAILLPQFKRIDAKLAQRENLAQRYLKGFESLPRVRTPANRPASVHARHLFPIRVDAADRDQIVSELAKHRIQTVVNYRAIHLLTYFRTTMGHCEGDFPIVERIGEESLSLPLYPTMPVEYVDDVLESIRAYFSQNHIKNHFPESSLDVAQQSPTRRQGSQHG